ncbi:amidohydrolase [Sulfobacillus harzensis]|uniref:Amidohydrolase n=1 Tax=Sulfobacillus harzensis TaxID=2729629 RepID=A0A7Y0L4J9_9FIRM|nr:amidohydrolase [Sulfobacillus harzensis]NMP23095.1 amidohydrolase [Sulfobacillus harzensis]
MQKQRLIVAGSVMSPRSAESLGNAVLVRDGRIVAIGQQKDFNTCSGVDILDMGEAHLFPGFVESHAHLWWMGQLETQIDCGPSQNHSVKDILQRVSEVAHRLPPGTWIQGHHWDDSLLAEGRPPTAEELTRAAPHHPVFLMHNSGHLAVANREAFEIAGIDNRTDIPGIVHDGQGKLTGLLLEAMALESVSRHIPPPSQNEMMEQIRVATELCHRQGVTSCTDMALGLGGQESSVESIWRAYQAAEATGALGVRTTCYVRIASPNTFIPPDPPTPFLTMNGVKLFSDGSIQGHTARLKEGYWDQPEEQGMLVQSQEELESMIHRYHTQGLQIAIHANGDQAIETVIAAYYHALGLEGWSHRRHRIEHVQLAHPSDIRAMARVGILPNFFIGHVYHWGDRHRDKFLGPHRAQDLDPLNTAYRQGIRFALHSDAPVTPINPLGSIATAVTRLTQGGQVLGPEQRIPLSAAWQAYTIDAAYLGLREHLVGDIKEGLWADFAVLSENPLIQGPDVLGRTNVLRTLVAGETVWES